MLVLNVELGDTYLINLYYCRVNVDLALDLEDSSQWPQDEDATS